jgi:hypothetical protein
VSGDIVRIWLGNVGSADVKLTDGEYLDVDQSALTARKPGRRSGIASAGQWRCLHGYEAFRVLRRMFILAECL